MKTRQYKKLCKKAMQILVTLGYGVSQFSVEESLHSHRGVQHWPKVWGLNTGPDHYGEYDWFDAWFHLCNWVAAETADWESYHGHDDDPSPYEKSIRGTRNILDYCKKLTGVKPS